MDVSATHLRHPLACKKFMMEFESRGNNDIPTPSSGQPASGESTSLQPFELFSRYTAVRPIASGTYGFVIAARDAKEVEAWHALPPEERTPDPEDGMDQETLYDQKTLVAIKKVPQLFESGIPRMWLCAAREAQMLMHFHHENVISARDVFIPLGPEHLATADTIRMRSKTFEDFYVVMDYKELTLRDVLRRAALTVDDGGAAPSSPTSPSVEDDAPQTPTAGSSTQKKTPRLCEITREPLCPLPKEYRQFLMYQLLRGVGYMHACRVMHRDLKPENVLVDLNYKLCICDFGQAKDLNEAAGEAMEDDDSVEGTIPNMTVLNNCTQWYAAPETLTLIPEQTGDSGVIEEDSLHSADVWSIGAIAAEMILGRPVFHTPSRGGFPQLRAITQVRGRITPADAEALSSGRHNEDRISYVQELSRKASAREQGDFKSFLRSSCPLDDTDDDELDLVEQLLAYDPKARPTPQTAIAHDYFVKSEYEPVVDPDNNARPLRTASKDSIRTADDARMLFWDLFLSFHGEVKQLVEVLSAQKAIRAQHRK